MPLVPWQTARNVLVGGGGAEVGERRVVVAARADVDVRGHVHQVPRTGREVAQRVGERSARPGSFEASTAWM